MAPGKPRAGVRNNLSKKFLSDLLAEWEVGGQEALKIARIEDPVRFCIIVANLLPKELEIAVGPMQQLSDEELEKFIEYARGRLIDVTPSPGNGESSEANGEPVKLLSSISETS